MSTYVKAPEDTQAALNVILEFRKSAGVGRLDLSNTNLIGVRTYHADLSHADFRNSSLVRAHLDQSDLDRSILSGTDLRYACLAGATFSDAILEHTRVNGADFSDATLTGARLTGAGLQATITSQCTVLPSGKFESQACPAAAQDEDITP